MIDFDKIRTFYKIGRTLTLNDAQILIRAAKSKSFAAGDSLIREGDLRREVFFIRKGLVRAFKVNDKGEEITLDLRCENQVVTSLSIVLFNQASEAYFQALEPTDVFYMDYDILQSIISNNPKLEAHRKYVFQKEMKHAYRRIDAFVMLSPEERYLQFVEDNPDMINRVHNKYIANMLGITPVSLSRIRKRISRKRMAIAQ